MPQSKKQPGDIRGGFISPSAVNKRVTKKVLGTEPLPQATKQGVSQGVKIGTKTATPKKENFKIGLKFEPGIELNLNQTFELQNGYDIPNYNGEPISVSSPKDGTYYDNPYVDQNSPSYNSATTCKTAFNVSKIDPFIAGTAAEEALQDVYSDLKIQINNSTGGGNTVTNTVFTYSNFIGYMKLGIKFYSYLIQLMARQAWSPDEDYANLVLRNLAETCSTTNAITLRNRLSRVLSNMSLPIKVKNYITWWYQVYQTNEGKTSKVQFNADEHFAGYVLTDGDIDTYIAFIDSEIDNHFTNNAAQANVAIRSQITALLENRTDYNFETLRRVNIPCNTSQYDQSMKDIMVNTRICDDASGTPVFYPPLLGDTETGPVCFEQSLDQIPVHTTESLTARFSNNQPAIFNPLYYGTGISATYAGFSRFVMFNDGNPQGYSVKPCNEENPQRYITDDAFQLFDDSGTTKWVFIPKGKANIVYQLGLNSVRTAQRKFVYDSLGFTG